MKKILLPKIKVFTGTMFSGKTSRLLNETKRYELAGIKTLLIKPLIINTDNSIINHNGEKVKAYSIDTDKIDDLSTLIDKKIEEENIQVVGIDEAQFFKQDLIGLIEYYTNNFQISFIISGLDKDYLGRPFGVMPFLLAIADDVEKLKAVCCCCGRDAIFEYRKNSGDKNLISIGSEEKYEPLCRICYNKKMKKDEE